MKQKADNNLSPEFQHWLETEKAAARRHRKRIAAVVSILLLVGLLFYVKRKIEQQKTEEHTPAQAIGTLFVT